MTNIAGRDVKTPDLVLLGTGVIALINLFLPWYRATEDSVTSKLEGADEEEAQDLVVDLIDKFGSSGSGDSVSANAFDAGFLAFFPSLLLIAVAALVAARIFAGFAMPNVPKAGPAFVFLAISGLATLLLVLKLAIDNDFAFIGLFIALVVGIVQLVFNFLSFKASGESMPDFGNRGPGTPPAPPGPPAPPAPPAV